MHRDATTGADETEQSVSSQNETSRLGGEAVKRATMAVSDMTMMITANLLEQHHGTRTS